MKALINGTVVLVDQSIEMGYVLFDTHIRAYGPMTAYVPSPEIETMDAHQMIICPGFIDIHIHGAGGYDAMDGHQEALENIAQKVRESGVTGFLATTMTMPDEQIIQAMDVVKAFKRPSKGASVLGVHLEGPFIHSAKKGAQNGAYIQKANVALIHNHLDIIKMITLAPDTEGAFEFIEEMKAYPHIQLSMGHTCSSFETAMKARDHGVTHITHCFNAMPALHHRAPGVIGAMMRGEFTTELIADDIHVHNGLYKGLLRSVGEDNLVLVTDSMQAGGLPDGAYELGGQAVTVNKGECRLGDGTLAGSVLTMNKAIENFLKAADIPLHKAVRFATLNPARVIGMAAELGSIEVGKSADFTLMDHTFEVITTYINGEAL